MIIVYVLYLVFVALATATCPDGQSEVNGVCTDNVCTCTGGGPVIGNMGGTICPSTGTVMCIMCNYPYVFSQNQCLPPPCACPNGAPRRVAGAPALPARALRAPPQARAASAR